MLNAYEETNKGQQKFVFSERSQDTE